MVVFFEEPAWIEIICSNGDNMGPAKWLIVLHTG
jgi:hypothetical protein